MNAAHIGATGLSTGMLVPVLVWASHGWGSYRLDAQTAGAIAGLLVGGVAAVKSLVEWRRRVSGVASAAPAPEEAKG